MEQQPSPSQRPQFTDLADPIDRTEAVDFTGESADGWDLADFCFEVDHPFITCGAVRTQAQGTDGRHAAGVVGGAR
jgi:hypothetical protein